MNRKAYPTDVSGEQWEFVAPCLTLMKEDAAQRMHALREFFHALRWFVRAVCLRRLPPNELPPWTAVQQQALRFRRPVVGRQLPSAAVDGGAAAGAAMDQSGLF